MFSSYENIRIYHDYEGLAKWATNTWATESNIAKYYIDNLPKKELTKCHFTQISSHTGIAWNEYVDKLAKKGCDL